MNIYPTHPPAYNSRAYQPSTTPNSTGWASPYAATAPSYPQANPMSASWPSVGAGMPTLPTAGLNSMLGMPAAQSLSHTVLGKPTQDMSVLELNMILGAPMDENTVAALLPKKLNAMEQFILEKDLKTPNRQTYQLLVKLISSKKRLISADSHEVDDPLRNATIDLKRAALLTLADIHKRLSPHKPAERLQGYREITRILQNEDDGPAVIRDALQALIHLGKPYDPAIFENVAHAKDFEVALRLNALKVNQQRAMVAFQ